MPAGPEMDVLIAERVIGLVRCRSVNLGHFTDFEAVQPDYLRYAWDWYLPGEPLRRHRLLHYSALAANAVVAIEKAVNGDRCYQAGAFRFADRWLGYVGRLDGDGAWIEETEGETFAHAACRALLLGNLLNS
jgi:hypothetical protein